MEIDLSGLIIAWSSIILGSVITYILVNNYEKTKDKIAIKEKLINEVNDMWQNGSKLLSEIISSHITEEKKIELVYNYSKHADKLEGFIEIYTKNSSLSEELMEIKENFGNNFKNLQKKVNEQKINNDNLLDTYLEFHKDFSTEMRRFLNNISKSKIKYKL